jgi:pyruvate-formate lyase-activating enzyme
VRSTTPATRPLIAEPYLHLDARSVYNPLTDRVLRRWQGGYRAVRRLARGELRVDELPETVRDRLHRDGWLVEDGPDVSRRFLLKYVSLEANLACNQACSFCPVSIAPRAEHVMPLELYRTIVGQLAAFRKTIQAVFMNGYNEPTVDRHFVERVAILGAHGLPSALLTNGSGLTPRRVDEIVALGGLAFLSVNLSTVDRERYRADRGGDHLETVLRNLDYAATRPVAREMSIVVLGAGDRQHRDDHRRIRRRFAGTPYAVKPYQTMDRAAYLETGLKVDRPHQTLRGCEQTGSRPLQHIHITARGQCVLCCQDYHGRHVVGDLTRQTVEEVLTGPVIARLRRQVYGLEEAPADFICRKCVFARTE